MITKGQYSMETKYYTFTNLGTLLQNKNAKTKFHKERESVFPKAEQFKYIEGGQKNQETLSERLEYYQTNQPNRHEKSEIT